MLAANKFQRLVAPDVIVGRVRRSSCGGERHLGVLVVRPPHAIATADRAIAIRDAFWLARNFNFDCATVAGCGEHLSIHFGV